MYFWPTSAVHITCCLSSQPEGGMSEETGQIETATQQTLHYTLANQQVQFHRIGEDGQVQVVSVRHLILQSFSEFIHKKTFVFDKNATEYTLPATVWALRLSSGDPVSSSGGKIIPPTRVTHGAFSRNTEQLMWADRKEVTWPPCVLKSPQIPNFNNQWTTEINSGLFKILNISEFLSYTISAIDQIDKVPSIPPRVYHWVYIYLLSVSILD